MNSTETTPSSEVPADDSFLGLWIETWTVFFVSMAALLTAWCAYQSNAWTGVQDFSLSDVANYETEISRAVIDLNQHKMMDAVIALFIIEALPENRQSVIEALISRCRPELQNVFRAWLALDPLNNKQAPPHPLASPLYVSSILKINEAEIDKIKQKQQLSKTIAQTASTNSDSYVLYTVLLAMVMFFGGISATLRSVFTRKAILLCSGFIFFITFSQILMTPVSFS